MKGFSKAKIVCFGGINASLAIIFQTAPIWLPMLGMAISPLSTLPVGVITFISPIAGVVTFLCASLLILAINVQEALIFFFSTGLLGLVLGLFLRKHIVARTLIPGLALFCGLNSLFYIFNINIFGPVTQYISGFIQIFFILFSILYSVFWSGLISLLITKLSKFKVKNREL